MSTTLIRNPVLHGFNPDPSICRVGDDYYIATSTFEWFPGIALHHSRDLVNWKRIGHALTRRSQLELRGIGDSCGLWAPSLSWHDGHFWLVVALVRSTGFGRPYKDIRVQLFTAPAIEGPWSDPIYLGGSGFDPSLFHDEDGRKWLVNIQWDFRKGHARFGGIYIQEYDHSARALVGSLRPILQKPVLIEGPNLYKFGGYFYLMLAEGGTGWNHGISMARAPQIEGPYELDPQAAVITTRDDPAWPLQKAGHGELVQTRSGEWWLVHLCSRPVGPERRCMLGRETAIQRVVWSEEGWLRLIHGDVRPPLTLEGPADLESQPWPPEPIKDDFNEPVLGAAWSTLRVPAEDNWLSLTARPSWLRLRGRESMSSLFEQSFVAKRLTAFRARAETKLEFIPTHFTQMAGLICWYDTSTYFYLRVSHDAHLGKTVAVILCDDGVADDAGLPLEIGTWPEIHLRAVIDHEELQFSASPDGEAWQAVGPVLEASKLSDDYGTGLHFTGAHVGLCAQDLNEAQIWADFDYFILEPAALETVGPE